MRFLITGATGMIGGGLGQHLRAAGHDIAYLDHRQAERPASFGRRYTGLDQATDGDIDVVVNLAGANMARTPWTAEGKQLFHDSRVGVTDRLVAWMGGLSRPPRLLISASAVGYYGDRGDEVLTEAAAPGAGFAAELCQAWEAAAERGRTERTRVAPLRIGLVISRRGGAFRRMAEALAQGDQLPLGDPERWISWIVDTDLFGMILTLAERPDTDGTFNAAAPNPVRRQDFTEILAASLGRPAPSCESAADLRARLGEVSEIMASSQRLSARRALAAGVSYAYPDFSAAARALTKEAP